MPKDFAAIAVYPNLTMTFVVTAKKPRCSARKHRRADAMVNFRQTPKKGQSADPVTLLLPRSGKIANRYLVTAQSQAKLQDGIQEG
jgi:hypothetical protein